MDSGISVTAVTTPALFTGPPGAPAQVVRVRIRRDRPVGPLYVTVHGAGLTTPHPRVLRAQRRAPDSTVEVAVRTGAAAPGELLSATARVATPDGRPLAELLFALTVAEPGWTVRLVPHFHYDPMWWNTQAAYTALWDTPLRLGEAERGWEYEGVPAFTLIPLHLQQAREDPAYRFVLSEVDYLKPYWDTHPADRAELRALIAEGRVEIVGGAYNEPSTNLVSAGTTLRGAFHGLALHRGTLGADPRTAWQLDAFGHDPSFPALMAGCGLDSAVLARGPHHHWGPMADRWGDPLRAPAAMQLPAEYEWIAPGGDGLLLHYLPAHYWPHPAAAHRPGRQLLPAPALDARLRARAGRGRGGLARAGPAAPGAGVQPAPHRRRQRPDGRSAAGDPVPARCGAGRPGPGRGRETGRGGRPRGPAARDARPPGGARGARSGHCFRLRLRLRHRFCSWLRRRSWPGGRSGRRGGLAGPAVRPLRDGHPGRGHHHTAAAHRLGHAVAGG
ncbi:hypothetical protein [Streptomyces sp. NPDC059566]|uniref:glycoside hydrolase family 38 N-terminal domain-containing protein n=1 Tax=Streptomyces sp. NPDC059566 TaxID=3346866 RepID=UPI00367D8093